MSGQVGKFSPAALELLAWVVIGGLGCASTPAPTVRTAAIPKSAAIYLDGARIGQTPLIVELDRTKGHQVRFEQAGYKGVSCTLEPGGQSEDGSRDWVLLDVMSGFMPAVADISAHCILHTRKSVCTPSYLRPRR